MVFLLWLKRASPVPVEVLLVEYSDTVQGQHILHKQFLYYCCLRVS